MTELSQLYQDFFHQEPVRVQMLGGSASNRRYFRLYHSLEPDSGSVIGVIGENRAENHAFVTLAHLMFEQGLKVPRVLATSADEMRYLQQDLGNLSLYDLIAKDQCDAVLLRQVMHDLPHLQFQTAKAFNFKTDCSRESRFSGMTIRWDLNYFKYCFLKLTGCPMDELKLEDDFERLTTALLDCTSDNEKWAFLYRDFQSRNVMLVSENGERGNYIPYYIDFQGGYEGPVYYDVAAFLWQTRANYAPELRDQLLTDYVDALQEYQPTSLRVFRHRLRVFVFFRLLQTLGAYGYRGLFEHKTMFQTPISNALQSLVSLTHPDSEPAFRNCSLRHPSTSGNGVATLQSLFGDAFTDTNWGPDDSAGCSVSDSGYADESVPAIDRFELEEDCPYLCQLLAEIAQMERFQPQPATGQLTVHITSFSYKRGIPEDYSGNGGGFVFDCRAPLNPGRFAFYKKYTGLDSEVIDFLEGRRDEEGNMIAHPSVQPTSMQTFVSNAIALVAPAVQTYLDRGFTSLMVSCGCTGGQHRSVYCAQHIADYIHAQFPEAHIILNHREQHFTKNY